MVCLHGGHVESAAIEEAVGAKRSVDPNGELVHTARSIGVCFGD
jgi:6-phosphofructokinase 1